MLRSLLLILLLPLALTACNESDDPVGGGGNLEPVLEGQVVNHLGVPVEGAAVALVYDFDPVAKRLEIAREGMTTLHFALAETSVVDLTILDIRGRHVATLFEGELPFGEHSATWDGTDDEGLFVPNGLYLARLHAVVGGEEEFTFTHRLFLQVSDVEGLVERPQTITAPDGRFEIPLIDLPVGEILNFSDEAGNDLGEHSISNVVNVWAIQEDKSALLAADVYVGLRTDGTNRVSLQLPKPEGSFP